MAYLANHSHSTDQILQHHQLTNTIHLTLTMTVSNNSSFQSYPLPDNHTMQTANMYVVIKIPTQNHKTTICCKVREEINRCTSVIALNSLKKRLRGHPNIVQFYSAASLSEKETDHGMSEYLILTELCSGKMLWLLSPERIALFTVNISNLHFSIIQHCMQLCCFGQFGSFCPKLPRL